jgi:hypothetical protein
MVVAIDEIVDRAPHKQHVDKRRNQRQKHLDDKNVGQREQPHGLVAHKSRAMLPNRLQRPK